MTGVGVGVGGCGYVLLVRTCMSGNEHGVVLCVFVLLCSLAAPSNDDPLYVNP